MKALVYSRYGSPAELRLADLAEPSPRRGEVRVGVRAVSLNGSDAEFLSGRPLYARLGGAFRPSNPILGSDVAGVVDAVGPGVTELAVGDAVVGDIFDQRAALAEKVCAPASLFVKKPQDVSFEDAAALPQAGGIAMQALELFAPEPGQRVLLVGAGGGVGSFAVQYAKTAGAHVTAVDAGAKLAGLEALGADVVVDYRRDDPLASGTPYDFVLDIAGQGSVRRLVRHMNRGGRYLLVGGRMRSLLVAAFLGPMWRLFGRRVGLLMWEREPARIEAMLEATRSGTLARVVGASVPLEQAPEAFRLLAEQSVCGKVVVTVG